MDDEVFDEKAERDVLELIGYELIGELSGELHQMVGRKRPADGNEHLSNGTSSGNDDGRDPTPDASVS
ncbi:hypothetical protein GCM10009855_18720 [Gordonia cholesterolivorans]|uniref:Uncharacterized protein n=1 Tax=Gordonia cholesterolivorans TaxID=559625 RepID=A0ABN3HFJ8_9ACTN